MHSGGEAKFVFPAEDDHAKFRTALGDIVTKNKEKAAAAAIAADAARGEGDPQSMADAVPGQGSSYTRAGQNQKRRLNKNELKAAVLKRSPELARLHADLVRNGHITEAEFWEGREVSSLSRLKLWRGCRDAGNSTLFSPKPPPIAREKAKRR